MKEQVLIVDDEQFVRDLLISQVSCMGYSCMGAPDGIQALQLAAKPPHPALVLSDLQMPDISGLQLLRQIRELDDNIQVVMVTANDDLNTVRECLRDGAYDYLVKPYDLEDLANTVERAIERCRLKRQVYEQQRDLERKVEEQTRAIREQAEELRQTRDIALLMLARLAECRDVFMGYHLERMARYSRALAETLRTGPYSHEIDAEFVDHLQKSSPLHDIGKVAIPDYILQKRGPLTPQEQAVMRTHTTIGGDTLKQIIEEQSHNAEVTRFLTTAMEIAYSHHEKWNGQGYPWGIAGVDIPLAARIVALADAYDAITSQRHYKSAANHTEAVRRIKVDRGLHFDPVIVDAFLRCKDQFEHIREHMQDDTVRRFPASLPSA